MDTRPIGVFDSGVGGLTVVKALMQELPQESIVYFGDTARVPYGSKSRETIQRFSLEILQFLLEKNVKAVIVACNSASATSLHLLREVSPVPVYGVIETGVRAAIGATDNNKVGVLGTKATIRSQEHQRIMQSLAPSVEVISKACPLFVPLIEEGLMHTDISGQAIKHYLRELKQQGIDTVILGCTHYPLLNANIQKYLGPKVALIDPALELVKRIKVDANTINKTEVTYQFFVSDVPEDFSKASESILKVEPEKIKKVVLDELHPQQILEAKIPL